MRITAPQLIGLFVLASIWVSSFVFIKVSPIAEGWSPWPELALMLTGIYLLNQPEK
jgi:hypothetical protein